MEETLHEKYKDYTFAKIIQETDIKSITEWDRIDAEEAAEFFGMDSVCIYQEVPFIYSKATDYIWTCTDTPVGLFLYVYVDNNGKHHVIGAKFKPARKSDPQYELFTGRKTTSAFNEFIRLITPKAKSGNVKITDRIFR